MFHDWTDHGKDMKFDDELIIEHDPKIPSVKYADYILKLQTDNKALNEQVARELKDNNALRITTMKYWKIKERWNEINVDVDAPEDCVKICKLLE